MKSKIGKGFKRFGLAGLAFFVFGILQCQVSETIQQEKYVSIKLNDSLKNYDSVEVLILADGAPSIIIGKPWSGPLTHPSAIPDYRIPDNENRNLSVQVKGFDSSGELLLNMLISKKEGKQDITYRPIVQASQSLMDLKPAFGSFTFRFRPEQIEYWLKYPIEESTLTLTAYSEYALAKMTLDGENLESGKPSNPMALPIGERILLLVVTAAGESKTYTITVFRAFK